MNLIPTLHIYTRVSTQTQQDEGTSLDSQRDLGIQKAEQMGFEYKVWNEGGASSNYEDFENRPILLQLLTEIDKGNVKHLWVYNNDRLSRNEITAHTIRVKLQSNAVTLYTNNGQFDLTNPQDGFLKTILDAVAQLDNAQRAERSRQGKLARVKQGFWMGGPPPYGYQILDKKLDLHAEESKWVKKIYEWYNEGRSTEWIKSKLDKAGVQTRRQKALWTLGSLQKILQNTHPTGYYTYTDSKTDESIRCTCPSIITHTLWNSCQDKRKKSLVRRGQNNRTQRFYLLRNLMFCGHCGSPMSGRIKENKNEYLYYCPHKERNWVKAAPKKEDKWKRGKGCSMVRSLNIMATDNLVKKEVMRLILHPRHLNDLIKKRLKMLTKISKY
jgi:DNA invertase Pin-like site-specific DNA recombinase